MKNNLHGFLVGIERTGDAFFLSLSAKGKLTHQDYEKISPMLDAAFAQVTDPKVKVFVDGCELEGWEPRAAWDDLKLGLKHGNAFEKVAIYGNKKWQAQVAKVGSWFTSGEFKFFEDKTEALAWLDL